MLIGASAVQRLEDSCASFYQQSAQTPPENGEERRSLWGLGLRGGRFV